jgi:hypothetical protein
MGDGRWRGETVDESRERERDLVMKHLTVLAKGK